MSDGCMKMQNQASLNKYPMLSIQTAKCFPEDFFGDNPKKRHQKEKGYPQANIFNLTKKERNMMEQTGRFNTLCFQEPIKEDPIEENIMALPSKYKDINDLPFSHRQMKKIEELDIENDEEPSTSGSYGLNNPLSNVNSPSSFTTVSPTYSLGKVKSKVKTQRGNSFSKDEQKDDYQKHHKGCFTEVNDLTSAFKETGHFFQCQTEANQPINHHHNNHSIYKPASTRNQSNKRGSTSKTRRNQSAIIEKSSPHPSLNPDKIKCKEKPMKDKESKIITPKLKNAPSSQRNPQQPNVRPKSVAESRNKAFPPINNPQIFTKELTDLIGNVPQEYINDPEIKKGLNTLLKNLNDFKQVITSKQTRNPIQSYNRVFNKNANNKPIKIVNNSHQKKTYIH